MRRAQPGASRQRPRRAVGGRHDCGRPTGAARCRAQDGGAGIGLGRVLPRPDQKHVWRDADGPERGIEFPEGAVRQTSRPMPIHSERPPARRRPFRRQARPSFNDASGAPDAQRSAFACCRGYWSRSTPTSACVAPHAGDAEDCHAGVLRGCLREGWLDRYDAERARFRTSSGCASTACSRSPQAATRQKRGGGTVHLALDFRAPNMNWGPRPLVPPDARRVLPTRIIRDLFSRTVQDVRREFEARVSTWP